MTRDGCVRNLLEITDGCDGNDPVGNPANFKGGGTATLGGAQYGIQPMAVRQPAKDGTERGCGCDCSNKWLWNDFVVWGRGWASGDFGQAFQDQIKSQCHLRYDNWRFEYGLGDDGREWTAWFRTDTSQSPCISWVAKLVGANDDFTCNGC
ncbi:MAG: Subtilisin-like protein [Massilia sp.]|nr:Subtilisin-like protein [Massilia sp.]